jgi:hypothetical protein
VPANVAWLPAYRPLASKVEGADKDRVDAGHCGGQLSCSRRFRAVDLGNDSDAAIAVSHVPIGIDGCSGGRRA